MSNRSNRRWLNLQVILASIAVTFTVGLWNVFAKGSGQNANSSGQQPSDPTIEMTDTPDPTAIATSTVDPNAPVRLPQVHLLLGGKAYVPPVVAPAAPSDSGGGNQSVGPKGGGGNPTPPPPAANTGSSKP
jgi:hypothetical protein